jgi:hypothetical protein
MQDPNQKVVDWAESLIGTTRLIGNRKKKFRCEIESYYLCKNNNGAYFNFVGQPSPKYIRYKGE